MTDHIIESGQWRHQDREIEDRDASSWERDEMYISVMIITGVSLGFASGYFLRKNF